MKPYLSPRDLAEAIGVSESSVKRWANDGLIEATRTAGGHRRITRAAAVAFVRRTSLPVVEPGLLGFGEVKLDASWSDEAALEDMLYDALVRGDGAAAQGLIHGPFLTGRPLVRLFDGPVRGAMHRIGELWQCQDDGIYLEHQATDICLRALMGIRLALPEPREGAPAAVGGAPTDDPYLLAGHMAAIILHDAGMNSVNLGPQMPLDVLFQGAQARRAVLAWLSITTRAAAEAARPRLAELAERLSGIHARLIIGGQALEALSGVEHPALARGQTMADLLAFLQQHGLGPPQAGEAGTT